MLGFCSSLGKKNALKAIDFTCAKYVTSRRSLNFLHLISKAMLTFLENRLRQDLHTVSQIHASESRSMGALPPELKSMLPRRLGLSQLESRRLNTIHPTSWFEQDVEIHSSTFALGPSSFLKDLERIFTADCGMLSLLVLYVKCYVGLVLEGNLIVV